MGSVSVPTAVYALAAAAAAGAAVSAYSAHETGVAQKNESTLKARQAGLDSGAKQIEIRQNMLRALASQNATAGAAGIGTGGSLGAGVQRQITQNQNDLLTLKTNTGSQQELFSMQGNAAETAGNLKAGSSLLDFAGSSSAVTLATG